jgi:hypothetical protein
VNTTLGTKSHTQPASGALLLIEYGFKYSPGSGPVIARVPRSRPASHRKRHYAAPFTRSYAWRAASIFFIASSFGKR